MSKDTDEFIDIVFDNDRCLVVVDEAGEAIGRAQSRDTEHRIKLATRTRHRGHSVFFIGQRLNLLPPAIRSQCEAAYVFRQNSRREIMLLAEEFGEHAKKVDRLAKGQCLYLSTFGTPELIELF